MAYTTHDLRLVYDAIVSRLTTETGKNIGDTQAPSVLTYPYAVVYHLDEEVAPELRGTLGDPQQSTELEFQVTSVSDTARSARWMANEARIALSGWAPTATGMTLGKVSLQAGSPTIRDDGVQPPVFYSVDRYVVFVN